MSGDGAVTVRAFESNDESRVVELLQRAFGRWPRHIDGVQPSEFFRWKHSTSPFGKSICLVAEAEDALIGFAALMPWRLRIGEQVLSAIRGVDLAVDPGYQRRGVSMRLIGAARGHYSDEVALGWTNPNEYSRGGVLKSGRRKVVGLPRYVGLGGWLASPPQRCSRIVRGSQGCWSRRGDRAIASRPTATRSSCTGDTGSSRTTEPSARRQGAGAAAGSRSFGCAVMADSGLHRSASS